MGGNQALQDCADALPQILRLNEMHKSGRPPSTEEIKQALDVFEASMLERTFRWVQKSGGSSILVGDHHQKERHNLHMGLRADTRHRISTLMEFWAHWSSF